MSQRGNGGVNIAHALPQPLDRERDLVILEREQHRRNKDLQEEVDLVRGDLSRRPEHFYSEVGSSSQERRRRRKGERKPKVIAEDTEETEDDADRKGGKVGRRYIGVKSRQERLWTEITKDLVVKEAIERVGYEYDETELYYYIFSYLQYVSSTRSITGDECPDLTACRRISPLSLSCPKRFAVPVGGESMRSNASALPCLLPHWHQ